MNLLVIGCSAQVPGFFRTLSMQTGQNVSFCSNSSEAFDLFHRTDWDVDWIFFADEPREEIMTAIRQMRDEGISSPIILCQTPEPADADAPLSPVLVGVFERTSSDGTLLGCNLVGTQPAREEGRCFADEILLEYHEPCTARKGSERERVGKRRQTGGCRNV